MYLNNRQAKEKRQDFGECLLLVQGAEKSCNHVLL